MRVALLTVVTLLTAVGARAAEIHTVVVGGSFGYTGDGGPATAASSRPPSASPSISPAISTSPTR
jgi:hypothetical protein